MQSEALPKLGVSCWSAGKSRKLGVFCCLAAIPVAHRSATSSQVLANLSRKGSFLAIELFVFKPGLFFSDMFFTLYFLGNGRN